MMLLEDSSRLLLKDFLYWRSTEKTSCIWRCVILYLKRAFLVFTGELSSLWVESFSSSPSPGGAYGLYPTSGKVDQELTAGYSGGSGKSTYGNMTHDCIPNSLIYRG